MEKFEQIDQSIENSEMWAEINETIVGTQQELYELDVSLKNQWRWLVEFLSSEQVDNTSDFIDWYLKDWDSLIIRARADGYSLSLTNDLKSRVNSLADNLAEKWINVETDLSTGNNALAWERALTILNQLPEETISNIKDKIEFDVKSVPEKDEKGTYRMASFDLKRGKEYIPDIQKINYKFTDIDILLEDNLMFENIEIPEKYKDLEWLTDGLNIPIGIESWNTYYIKRTFYKRENWKLNIKNGPRKTASKRRYKETFSDKWLKMNSISMDASEVFKDYSDVLEKKDWNRELKPRLDFLNKKYGDSMFAIEQLYDIDRKWKDSYVARVEKNEKAGDPRDLDDEGLLASK